MKAIFRWETMEDIILDCVEIGDDLGCEPVTNHCYIAVVSYRLTSQVVAIVLMQQCIIQMRQLNTTL